MPIMNDSLAWIGRGIAYPFRFDETGQVVSVAGNDVIRDDLRRLLTTEPGEDPFLYRNGVPYGVRMSQILFSDFSTAKDILEFELKLAIETWMPEVQLLGIQVTREVLQKPERVVVYTVVSYRLRSNGQTDALTLATF